MAAERGGFGFFKGGIQNVEAISSVEREQEEICMKTGEYWLKGDGLSSFCKLNEHAGSRAAAWAMLLVRTSPGQWE